MNKPSKPDDIPSLPDRLSVPDSILSGERRDDYIPGDVLDGRYRVESVLGSGGMGMVYRVTQMFVDKQFALKTIIKGQLSEVKIRRFQQEARAVFALDHPNIVAVKDFGIIEEMTPFLVMELLDGENLSDRLKRTGRLPITEIIPIFVQTCFGLGYAHDQGIVHRDIKPSNIMILNGIAPGAEGSVKIVDFGIAKFAQSEGGDIQALTKTGEIFGSPFYMSPEQCTGDRVDHRADIYSLGCVLFEALTGAPPCVGDNALSTMMQHQTAKLPSLKEASMGLEFPAELERIVAKMLEKNPDNRYQKLGIVAHRLASLGQVISHTMEPKDKTLEFRKAPAAKPKVVETVTFSKSKFIALISAAAAVVAILAGLGGYLLGRAQTNELKQETSNSSSKQEPSSSDRSKQGDLTSGGLAQGSSSEGAKPKVLTQDLLKQESLKQDALRQEQIALQKKAAQHIDLPRPVLIPSVSPAPIPLGPRQVNSFSFPKNMCVGILKIDDQQPKSVVGETPFDRKSKLTFYTRHGSKYAAFMLNKFRDDDLNGLECCFRQPQEVIGIVRNWKRLQNLTFFDPLIKAMPGAEGHDESSISDEYLPSIDKLKTLTTLGLCGPYITGEAVAKMSLLRSLNTIKLKDIRDVDPLLKVLPQHNNIEEVCLINQGTDNRQLELLARIENLKALTIKRAPRLGPDSLPIFQSMKKLKSLTLDRNNWSEKDKQKFKKAFPNCRFEPVIDIQYWFLLPDSPVKMFVADVDAKKLNSLKTQNEIKTASKTADQHFDIGDSKSEFGLVDTFMQGKAPKLDITGALVNVDDLEELGATPKEIRMISHYPFSLIEPHEKAFGKRLNAELDKPTKWSHR
ncbi:MAG: serine/threonine protein kinase [Cyanobacteria bacterium SZAS-4]|nr:serine/threonine protein kinase [Cyanobacteria bacterium SZAS-4]